MRRFAFVVLALLLVALPAVGVAEEGSAGEDSAGSEYEWRSCAGEKVRFMAPVGWRLETKEVSEGVVSCSLTAGPGASGALREGRVTFTHWSKWPVSAGVQPSEYAVSAIQNLSRMGRVLDDYSGAKGASLVHRMQVVSGSGEEEHHLWVLFVAHPQHGRLERVTAEWPESSWEEAWGVVQSTLGSLVFVDLE